MSRDASRFSLIQQDITTHIHNLSRLHLDSVWHSSHLITPKYPQSDPINQPTNHTHGGFFLCFSLFQHTNGSYTVTYFTSSSLSINQSTLSLEPLSYYNPTITSSFPNLCRFTISTFAISQTRTTREQNMLLPFFALHFVSLIGLALTQFGAAFLPSPWETANLAAVLKSSSSVNGKPEDRSNSFASSASVPITRTVIGVVMLFSFTA